MILFFVLFLTICLLYVLEYVRRVDGYVPNYIFDEE